MRNEKRELFRNALAKAVATLESEKETWLGRIPGLKGQYEEAIQSLRGLISDVEGVPRLILAGNTGVGKSTLINNLMGQEVAAVGVVQSETATHAVYGYPPPAGDQFELIDTRGLNELFNADVVRAQLQRDLLATRPHLLIGMVRLDKKDSIDRELGFFRELQHDAQQKFQRPLHSLLVGSFTDGITPSGFGHLPPEPWRTAVAGEAAPVSDKREIIARKLSWLQEQAREQGLTHTRCVPVAMQWGERRLFWNRTDLMEALTSQATVGLLLGMGNAASVEETMAEYAYGVTLHFAQIAGTLCLNPIPLSDALILVPLQFAMLRSLSAFGSRGTMSPEALIEAAGVAAFIGKNLAKTMIKVLPGGQLLNAAVAGALTFALGHIAIRHFVYGELPHADKLDLFAQGRLLWERFKKGDRP